MEWYTGSPLGDVAVSYFKGSVLAEIVMETLIVSAKK
jgi:hypothetical protein